ncbi:hemerythrin domain-containing protein [Streptacidiphilus carbonis]|uniref:hemerythrin domain-containing protein n=1 Tax=Streptacidiphilus carbonis TaxID=105422 RepID=UPI0005A9F44B|nr:hemerythrin domain-containing protein [Streptacidiphilus carbonis]
MCHYCGCRDIPLIREFIAEHESVTNLAGDFRRALQRGGTATARVLVDRISAELSAHWRGEEDGLFAVMAQDPEYTAYIDDLVREHRELHALLAAADLGDPGDADLVLTALDGLHQHIAKEEDGLFPASLTALSGPEWDFAMAAWRETPRPAKEPGHEPGTNRG